MVRRVPPGRFPESPIQPCRRIRPRRPSWVALRAASRLRTMRRATLARRWPLDRHPLAVHDQTVFMVASGQHQVLCPPALAQSDHGRSVRLPAIEGAGDGNRLGAWRGVFKMNPVRLGLGMIFELVLFHNTIRFEFVVHSSDGREFMRGNRLRFSSAECLGYEDAHFFSPVLPAGISAARFACAGR